MCNQYIQIQSAEYTYPHSHKPVLCHFDLSVRKNELLCILGPNGCGKSTILNCLCGLIVPQKGKVLIDGKSPDTLPPSEIAKHIGYVRQEQNASFGYTVYDYVLMGRAYSVPLFRKPSRKDFHFVENALQAVGIYDMKERLITDLSGGERQLASIARVIAQDPEVILLDEPTAHLDYGKQLNVLKLIRQLNRLCYTVVMTTHNPDHCLLLDSDVVVFNSEGILGAGRADDILTSELLTRLYHVPIQMVYSEDARRKTFVFESLSDTIP